ncbi:MAG: acyl-CoA thioesterase [Spirochaetaceae bacterium]|jgi:acyl-CoA thioester hydrolase|nr:acyl-CoA thioesterase [Spirochaetaceae bacterium]
MVSERKIRVRTYECDSNGHVNNATYLNYLEYGRFEFLRDIGFDYQLMLNKGYGVFVARVEIDYKRPALMDDEILIQSWPVKKGAVSGVIGQKITRGDDVIAEAKVTWAFVDAKGVPSRLPPEFNIPLLGPDS